MMLECLKRLFKKKHQKGCKCPECLPCTPKKKAVEKKAVKKKK